MGIKYYRNHAKGMKFRKRFTYTRTWFSTHKWVACKRSDSRLRSSQNDSRASFQRRQSPHVDRSTEASGAQEVWTHHTSGHAPSST